MEKKINSKFCELSKLEIYEVDGGWGEFFGAAESFLTNRLIWTNAKLTYGNAGGLIIDAGTVVA